MTNSQNKFRIVKIVDETKFIINAGKIDGIDVDDKFNILNNSKEKIIDPETDEVLGEIESTKGTIIVSKAYDKMSICRSSWIEGQPTLGMNFDFMEKIARGHYKELNVDEDDISALGNTSEPIKVGDYVERVSN